jgi:hypothetical protein
MMPIILYSTAWAFRRIIKLRPLVHIDIGSSLSLCSLLSSVIPVYFIDFRPLNARIEDLHSICGDIEFLPFESNCIHSLSCLHVIEHIGLGRYGDILDPEGMTKALMKLAEYWQKKGNFFLALPVGGREIMF